MLGLDPRGGGPGEELGQVGALQVDQHQHALAADQQGQEWHHEPWWLAHTPGDKKVLCCLSSQLFVSKVEQDASVSESSPHIANIGA